MDFDFTTETITPEITNVLTIGGTGGLELSVGTTAERPVSPLNGTLRYNTDLSTIEGYSNNSWNSLFGVTSFQTTLSGLTPSTSSTGAVILAGTLGVSSGGTGQTSYTNGQILIGNSTGNTLTKSTLTAGTGISITNGPGSITISSTTSGGTVTSVAATGSTGLSVTGSPITSSGTLSFTLDTGLQNLSSLATVGILVATGTDTWATRSLTAGTGISITNADGVTAAPTITNSGVTSFSAGTTGLTPAASTTGAVTLGGTLSIANGGTGTTTTPSSGQLLIGNGTGYTVSTLTAGDGITVTNSAGGITISTAENAPGSNSLGTVYISEFGALSGTTQFSALIPPTNTTGWLVTTSPSITPSSTSSRFIVDVSAWVDASSNNRDCSMAVFRGTTLVALSVVTVTTSGRPQTIRCYAVDSPSTTSPITYTVRFGMNNLGTSYINQSVSATIINDGNSIFTVTELY